MGTYMTVVEEMNSKLFENTVNNYLRSGKYRLLNCSVTGGTMTKYVAFLINDENAKAKDS